jgi:hypothetical protein
MLRLSERYVYGYGEIPDALEAARWRYLAYTNDPVMNSYFVDMDYNPKAQDTLALDEMARALSLFLKSDRPGDAASPAALAKLYLAAGQPGHSVALFRIATRRGSPTADAELKRLEPTLSSEQRAIADDKQWLPTR